MTHLERAQKITKEQAVKFVVDHCYATFIPDAAVVGTYVCRSKQGKTVYHSGVVVRDARGEYWVPFHWKVLEVNGKWPAIQHVTEEDEWVQKYE